MVLFGWGSIGWGWGGENPWNKLQEFKKIKQFFFYLSASYIYKCIHMYLMIQAYNVQIMNTMTFLLNTTFEFFENYM